MRSRLRATRQALARTLAGARVGPGALTVDGQPFAMTETAVRPEIHQALDVLLHFTACVAFYLDAGVDSVTNVLHVRFAQLVDLTVFGHLGHLAQFTRGGVADPVDVRERVDDCLAAGEIDTSNAGHDVSFSALALLVARVIANHAQDSAALHDFALVADLLNTRSHLHDVLPSPLRVSRSESIVYLG